MLVHRNDPLFEVYIVVCEQPLQMRFWGLSPIPFTSCSHQCWPVEFEMIIFSTSCRYKQDIVESVPLIVTFLLRSAPLHGILRRWSFLQRPFHIDSSSVHYSQYCQRQLSMFTPSFLRHHWRNSSMVVPNIYSNSNVQCEHGSHSCGELHYHRVPFHTNNFSTDLKLHTRQSMFGHSHTDSPTGPFISPLAGIIFGLIPFAKGMWSGPFGAGAGGGRCRATMCPPFGKCPFGMCPLTMGELGELKVRGEPGPCLRGPVNRNEKIITLDLKYNSDIAVLLFNNFVYFWQNLTGL